MKEYKVERYKITLFEPTLEAETAMNNMAQKGWRVVSTTVEHGQDNICTRLIVTYERDK